MSSMQSRVRRDFPPAALSPLRVGGAKNCELDSRNRQMDYTRATCMSNLLVYLLLTASRPALTDVTDNKLLHSHKSLSPASFSYLRYVTNPVPSTKYLRIRARKTKQLFHQAAFALPLHRVSPTIVPRGTDARSIPQAARIMPPPFPCVATHCCSIIANSDSIRDSPHCSAPSRCQSVGRCEREYYYIYIIHTYAIPSGWEGSADFKISQGESIFSETRSPDHVLVRDTLGILRGRRQPEYFRSHLLRKRARFPDNVSTNYFDGRARDTG